MTFYNVFVPQKSLQPWYNIEKIISEVYITEITHKYEVRAIEKITIPWEIILGVFL